MTRFAVGDWARPLPSIFSASPKVQDSLEPDGVYRVTRVSKGKTIDFIFLALASDDASDTAWNDRHFDAAEAPAEMPMVGPSLEYVLQSQSYATAEDYLGRLIRNPVDARRVYQNDWTRVDGKVVCEGCGFEHWQHPQVPGYPWLRRRCDGRLVKL